MKIFVKVLLLCISLALTFSCTSDEGGNTSALEGTWTWSRTTGGIAGENETPQNTGIVATMVFSGNIVRRYQDGVLIFSSPFSIRRVAAPTTQNPNNKMFVMDVRFPDQTTHFELNFYSSSFTIYPIGCDDCYTTEYQK